MEVLENLSAGFAVALTLENLFFCFAGAMIGTLVGVLPGIGPIATVAMLLPITFTLPPIGALIMLAGIYYGAQYGGSTTAILVALPGESSSVVTILDGHQMARQGRAGPALAVAALGSFFAGSVATLVIALFSPSLTTFAQQFGPADYFALMVLGVAAAIVLAHGSPARAVAMALVGLLLGLVGTDVNSGRARYTFGIPELVDGIGFVPLAMGLFGIAEIMLHVERGERRPAAASIDRLWPTRSELREAWSAVLRGTGVGSMLGMLPGGGAILSAFAAYTIEKKISPTPEHFGQGAIQGVAAPESANNAGAQTSFIPMLALGIPPNAVMALMVGAMTVHGIVPGPQVMTDTPDLFWGMVASMWLGNLMLVVINLPLIGLWMRLLRVPYRLLFPAILLFCCIGVYAVNSSWFDVALTAGFGLAGYVFARLRCEAAPLLLCFVLAPLLEENLGRALLLSQGDVMVFLTRPISAVMLTTTVLLLGATILPSVRRGRERIFARTT